VRGFCDSLRVLTDKDDEMKSLQQLPEEQEHQQDERLLTGLKEVSVLEIDEFASMLGIGLDTGRAVISAQVIGKGGFAVVHRGTYRFPGAQTPKDVAVKIFHVGVDITTSTAEQIKKELSLGIKLSHPNLVRLFGVLTDATHGPCLVLELCDGGSLSSVFNDAREGRIILPWKTRVKWLCEIAVGVDFLHSCQPRIIHRDLKPGNILLSSEDFDAAVAKVADFGVSTTLEKTKMSTASAKGGAGTLAWSAPETFKGEYSWKSDTYAFAMVMYESLTFLRPHAGKSPAEITRMGMEKFKVNKKMEERGLSAEEQEADWLEENPLKARRPDLGQVPRDCPELLLSLMQTCWSDSPDKRPSFHQIVDDLGKIQEPAEAAMREELANLKDEMRKREEEKEAAMKELEKFQKLQLEAENIVGKDYPRIFEAVQKNLVRKSPQATRMVGILKDLNTGKFADSAYGFKKFLKVAEDWVPEKECEVTKLEEEVSRLADCAECAKVHVQVLQDMVDEGSEDLRGTLEITKRLIDALEVLQFYRRQGKFKVDEARAEKEVQLIRKEINEINGWYYGRQNAPAVAWPESQVTHDWGKYGQPICDACKKYGLDHSAISADFNYVLYETSSEKQYPNGVRDKDRAGKSIDDFWKMPQSKRTKMHKSEAVALRFYSSPSFPAVTNPLRDPDRTTQHPLAAIVYCIFTAIRKQLALHAEDQDAAIKEVIVWRGFSDMQISDNFQKYGGSEFAPMSTSTDPSVAVGYAVRKSQTDGALLMRIVTKNNLQRGIVFFACSLYLPCLYISSKLGYFEGSRTARL
jgi:serine/threonine protein kinase